MTHNALIESRGFVSDTMLESGPDNALEVFIADLTDMALDLARAHGVGLKDTKVLTERDAFQGHTEVLVIGVPDGPFTPGKVGRFRQGPWAPCVVCGEPTCCRRREDDKPLHLRCES